MRASLAVAMAFSAISFSGPIALAQATPPWQFPNFSDRVQLVVTNPGNQSLNALAILEIADVRRLAPAFPGTLAIAATTRQPANLLPTQVDDLDGDAQPDEFAVAVALAPHEAQTIAIYFSTTLHDTLPQVQRVDASHSYGYNRATASLESERIGYRTYGGFFFDVQAHARNQSGLFNTAIGYASISSPLVEGQDVIHLGDTLGLGGLFLRSGQAVFRPPINTPDYTHRPPQPGEPIYRIVARGPLRAIIEASLPHWAIGQDTVSLRALYEIRAGEESVRCHWWLTPIRLTQTYQAGAGVRDLPHMSLVQSDRFLVVSGTQETKVGPLALGLSYDPAAAHPAGALPTPGGPNETITFAAQLQPDQTLSGEYAFAAAWSGSGWPDVAAHLKQALQAERIQPRITLTAHESNPKPQRLEAEPQ